MAVKLATKEEEDFYYKQVKIRTGHTRFVDPEYFRHPDGQDLSGKLRCTTKWAAIFSGMFGLVRAVTLAEKNTKKEWAFLLLKPVVPAVGMAAIFTTTTYMATNIRKKDDGINYALGGAAAGLIYGAALRSIPQGIVGFFGLGMAAFLFKSSTAPIVHPVHRKNFSPYEARILDFSFTPPKKGNWSKEKVEN